jgi:hypothetical protein
MKRVQSMNTRALALAALAVLASVHPLSGQDLFNFAEDTAGNYQGGWASGSNGGYGFGPWGLVAQHGEGESYAGFFVARKANHAELQGITRDFAFGLYANGRAFEEAVAFRPLKEPLRSGDAFSVLLEHGPIRPKFEEGGGGGALGFTLRTGNVQSGVGDYHAGARFEFVALEGQATYRLIDGEPHAMADSGVVLTEGGIEVTFVLVGADRYDLQVRVLETDQLHEWKGRRLGGQAGGAIESFAVFNRNGERSDLYFEGLQVNREVGR